MKMQLIRNATLKLDYAGRKILIDPFFAAKHSRPSLAGRSQNPLVDLPVSIDDILAGVELVIVSHLHADHFDPVAQSHVPKHLPIICQPGDDAKIKAMGFADVTSLVGAIAWGGITVTYRAGQHGVGSVVDKMGSVMGFSLEAQGEPHVYWAGDAVLDAEVLGVIQSKNPAVIVIHPSGAQWQGDPIAMTALDAIAVSEVAPRSIVVATHLEALDHTTVSRERLRHEAQAAGIAPEHLLIPLDGETISFTPRSARNVGRHVS